MAGRWDGHSVVYWENCEAAHWQVMPWGRTCGILRFLVRDIEPMFWRSTMALCHHGLGLCVCSRAGQNSEQRRCNG